MRKHEVDLRQDGWKELRWRIKAAMPFDYASRMPRTTSPIFSYQDAGMSKLCVPTVSLSPGNVSCECMQLCFYASVLQAVLCTVLSLDTRHQKRQSALSPATNGKSQPGDALPLGSRRQYDTVFPSLSHRSTRPFPSAIKQSTTVSD